MTFSLARLATQAGAHPLGMTFYQGFLGGCVLLLVCGARRRSLRLTRQFFKFYVLLGLVGTALPGSLFFYASPNVPAGILAITIATVPLMTYAASSLLKIDRFSPRRMAGIGSGLLAIVFLVGPDTSLPDRSMVFWILVVLLASALYTFENIYVAARVPVGTDMTALLCGMLLMAGMVLLPLVLLLEAFVSFNWPWGTVEWCIVGMAFVSSVAYAMFFHVIKHWGPVFASQTG